MAIKDILEHQNKSNKLGQIIMQFYNVSMVEMYLYRLIKGFKGTETYELPERL